MRKAIHIMDKLVGPVANRTRGGVPYDPISNAAFAEAALAAAVVVNSSLIGGGFGGSVPIGSCVRL